MNPLKFEFKRYLLKCLPAHSAYTGAVTCQEYKSVDICQTLSQFYNISIWIKIYDKMNSTIRSFFLL